MRETGEPTFVVADYYWRARLRARGSARSRGSRAVSTHGLNTQRMSAVQKAWSSYVYATILLQHGACCTPNATPPQDRGFLHWRFSPHPEHSHSTAVTAVPRDCACTRTPQQFKDRIYHHVGEVRTQQTCHETNIPRFHGCCGVSPPRLLLLFLSTSRQPLFLWLESTSPTHST
jgi:hypothetical protein